MYSREGEMHLTDSVRREEAPFFREVVMVIDSCKQLMRDDKIYLRNLVKSYSKELRQGVLRDPEQDSTKELFQIFMEAERKRSLTKFHHDEDLMAWLQRRLRKFVKHEKLQKHKLQISNFKHFRCAKVSTDIAFNEKILNEQLLSKSKSRGKKEYYKFPEEPLGGRKMSIISNSSIEKIKPKKNFSSQFSAAPQRTKFNPHSSPNPSPSPQRRDPNIFQTNRNSKCRLSSSKHDLDNSWENIHGSKSPKNMRHLLNNCKKRFEDKSFRKEDDSKRPLSRPSDFDSRGRQLNDKDAHELAKILHNHLNRQQTGKESQPSSIGINETRFEQPSWDRHLNGSDQFGLNVSHQQLLKDLSNSKVDMRSDNYGDMRGQSYCYFRGENHQQLRSQGAESSHVLQFEESAKKLQLLLEQSKKIFDCKLPVEGTLNFSRDTSANKVYEVSPNRIANTVSNNTVSINHSITTHQSSKYVVHSHSQQFPALTEDGLFTSPQLLEQCRKFASGSLKSLQTSPARENTRINYEGDQEVSSFMNMRNMDWQLDRDNNADIPLLRPDSSAKSKKQNEQPTTQMNQFKLKCPQVCSQWQSSIGSRTPSSEKAYRPRLPTISSVQGLLKDIFHEHFQVNLTMSQFEELMSATSEQIGRLVNQYLVFLQESQAEIAADISSIALNFITTCKYLYTYGKELFGSIEQPYSMVICNILDITKKGAITLGDIGAFLQNLSNAGIAQDILNEIKFLLEAVFRQAHEVERSEKILSNSQPRGREMHISRWGVYYLQIRKAEEFEKLCEVLEQFQFHIENEEQ